LAVNKPAGLLTQGVPQGLPTLEAQVKAYLKERYSKPGNVYLGIPHRLDRPVSGVIIFARNSKAARRLAEQFYEKQVRKLYWGIVESPPDPPSGRLRDWLKKLPDQARAELVSPGTPSSRECLLNYRTLSRAGEFALVEIEPLTGRMHQIRAQFASRGWSLVGDFSYGAQIGICPERSPDWRAEPVALHARSITFRHPIRYDEVSVVAPVPDTWKALPVAGDLIAGLS
jgi:23S rRNA pseudouridine1911/1915/1917 synthase